MLSRTRLLLGLVAATVSAIAACVGSDPDTGGSAPTIDAAPAPTVTATTTATTPTPDSAPPDAGSTCEQRLYPDAAVLSYCEDFDDQTRDGGWVLTTYDAGHFNRETNFFNSAPAAVLGDPGTTSVPSERGGFIHWPIDVSAPIHTINVRLRLRPDLDTLTHTHDQGFTDIITVSIGTATTVLRYTYGRDLFGNPDYVGYSLITHIPPADAGADAGDDTNPADFTVAPILTGPAAGAFSFVYLEVTTLGNAQSGSVMFFQINNVTLVDNVPINMPAASDGFVEVGTRAEGIMDAPSAHYIDDVFVDVFK